MSAEQQREALRSLTGLAHGDLEALWRLLRGEDPRAVRDALMDVLPALSDQYGDAAAALAADWFDQQRGAAEVRGSFRPVVAPGPTRARWEALSRWGVDPLFGSDPDWQAALSLIGGGLQRTIADRHRRTIADSAIADPQAAGWRRVTRPGSCGFCRMLAGREGHVYTEASVMFKSHDHCGCTAAPSWAPNVRKIIGVPFQTSQRRRSDAARKADNQRAYAFIRDNFGD